MVDFFCFWLGSGYADLLKSLPKGRQGVTFHNISVQCFHRLQTFCSPPGQEGRWLSGDQEGSSEESEERHFLHCRALLREHAERKIAAEKQKLGRFKKKRLFWICCISVILFLKDMQIH